MSEPPLHAGPDGPHAHPRKTGIPRLDLVLAVAAVLDHQPDEHERVPDHGSPLIQIAGAESCRPSG
ncbi:MAG TPA: hypothetical protein VGF42_05750 [Caulobacteraceae bacterium]|jgi:hypothetical protein